MLPEPSEYATVESSVGDKPRKNELEGGPRMCFTEKRAARRQAVTIRQAANTPTTSADVVLSISGDPCTVAVLEKGVPG